MPLSVPIPIGTVLENRYQVARFLGHGGFGRTYLVKDQHRFDEQCVLKEFAPQVSQPSVLQKAEELFQREAGTLYRLEHPQIPKFRALSSVQLNGEKVVFLVEQFIDGYNYGEWIEQGHCLSQAQGLKLLQDLLPVLSYLHQKGVIHRDIAPDNIMCDRSSGQPILIDFGSVKQVTQTALQLVGNAAQATQIHKPGYTPIEQIKGEIHPNSDLYALAVTVLVLITAKNPIELFDDHYQVWNWQKFVRLDSQFEAVLYRMLGRHTSDRYSSADEALQALSQVKLAQEVSSANSQVTPGSPLPVTVVPAGVPAVAPAPPPTPANFSTVKTIAVAPAWNSPAPTHSPQAAPPAAPQPLPVQPMGYSAHSLQVNPTAAPSYPASNPRANPQFPAVQPPVYVPPRPPKSGNWLGRSIAALFLLPFKLIGAILKLIWGGIRLVDMMFTWLFRLVMIGVALVLIAVASVFGKPDWLPSFSLPSLPGGSVASNQSQGCQDLQGRAERSGMTYAQLNTQVNQKFYKRYPNLKGRALTNSTEDATFRDAWCVMADDLLDRSERR